MSSAQAVLATVCRLDLVLSAFVPLSMATSSLEANDSILGGECGVGETISPSIVDGSEDVLEPAGLADLDVSLRESRFDRGEKGDEDEV